MQNNNYRYQNDYDNQNPGGTDNGYSNAQRGDEGYKYMYIYIDKHNKYLCIQIYIYEYIRIIFCTYV
jgi:hypothetical protein